MTQYRFTSAVDEIEATLSRILQHPTAWHPLSPRTRRCRTHRYQHVNPKTGKQVTIAEVIDFGKEYLGVDYIFWCTEEPYYSEHLIPFMKR